MGGYLFKLLSTIFVLKVFLQTLAITFFVKTRGLSAYIAPLNFRQGRQLRPSSP